MTNETTAPELIERLRLYERCWGDEPSIAPHVENSPGITTGRVIMDANEAADALEAAQARIAELEGQNSVDHHQRLGRDRDIILEAINEYDAWMLDDDYEATSILHKIMTRMKARAALEGKG